jgi:XTP/dITP diphosphohydrolase
MESVLVASRNAKKCGELRELLGSDWEVFGMDAVPGVPEVEEDADTFRGNAEKKALALTGRWEGWVLADDSGLEVDALGGEPGVRSARYAGVQGDDAANNARLLERLRGVTERGAQFRCCVVVARAGRVWFAADGVCRGRIIESARGAGGFGYDPLFVPDDPAGAGRTFAELSSGVKHAMSHRGRAMAQVVEWMRARGGG